MTVKPLLPAADSRFPRLKPMAVFGLLALCLCFPDIAAASGGITEFSSPLERVVNTITGPAGKWISIVAMALCGVIFIMNKDGSFLAGWEIRGQDTASSTEGDLALVSSRFNNAVKLLGSGWMLRWMPSAVPTGPIRHRKKDIFPTR